MPITPLPQFEADLKEYQDQLAAEAAALEAPKTMVVRFGSMYLIGEYPYDGGVKPGCGSKVVARTHRGTELAEVLTVTCENAGCGKSVTRKQLLGYIESSGGKDYPFYSQGRVLRIATHEDMDRQAAIEQSKHELVRKAREAAASTRTPVKIVQAEPILGGERVTYYYHTEDRVDPRALHRELSKLHDCRVEVRQVGARDEARLIADYERCGQHCCCKNFLKVLKPISMRSAKTQKATLEPLKISGRCGRLMCCLRYEDKTYEELRKRLPHRKKRVGTPEGDGIVIQGQILTQLVLVRLDSGSDAAIPVEDLTEPDSMTPPAPGERRPRRDRPAREGRESREGRDRREDRGRRRTDRDKTPEQAAETDAPPKKKKRRRRRKKTGESTAGGGSQPRSGGDDAPADRGPDRESEPRGEARAEGQGGGDGSKKKKRRRRRRKRRSDGGDGGGGGPSGPGGDSGGPDGG